MGVASGLELRCGEAVGDATSSTPMVGFGVGTCAVGVASGLELRCGEAVGEGTSTAIVGLGVGTCAVGAVTSLELCCGEAVGERTSTAIVGFGVGICAVGAVTSLEPRCGEAVGGTTSTVVVAGAISTVPTLGSTATSLGVTVKSNGFIGSLAQASINRSIIMATREVAICRLLRNPTSPIKPFNFSQTPTAEQKVSNS